MSPNLRKISLAILTLLLGGILGCDRFGYTSLLEIDELEQQRLGSKVYLKGTVGDRATFLGSAAYQLKDKTGTIWVITEQSIPPLGTQILLKGQLKYKSIPVGEEQDVGEFYVIEHKQIAE